MRPTDQASGPRYGVAAPDPQIRFCIRGVAQNSAQTAQNSTKVAQISQCFRPLKIPRAEIRKNATVYMLIDRFAIWVVDSDGPAEKAQVQSYSPGGANVQSWENTLPPPGNTIEPSVCGGDAPYVKLL